MSNQIKTVIDPEYELYVDLEGYYRVSQFQFCPEDFQSGDGDSVKNTGINDKNLYK